MDAAAENFLVQKYNMDRNKARAIISFYKSYQRDEPQIVGVPGIEQELTPEELQRLLGQQQAQTGTGSALREFEAPGVNPPGTSGPGDPVEAEGFWEKTEEWWEGTWPWSPMQLWNMATDPAWIVGMYTPATAYIGGRGLLATHGAGLPFKAAYPFRGIPTSHLWEASKQPDYARALQQWYASGRQGAAPTPPGGITQTTRVPGTIGRLARYLRPGQTPTTQTATQAAQQAAARVTQSGTRNIPGQLTPTQAAQIQRATIIGGRGATPGVGQTTAAEIETLIAQQEAIAAGRGTAGQGVTAQPGFWSRAGTAARALPGRIGSGITSGAAGLGAGLSAAAYGTAGSTLIGAAAPLAAIIGARAAGEILAPEYQAELSRQGYNELLRPYIPLLQRAPQTQEEWELQRAGSGFWSGLEQSLGELQAFTWPWE